MKPLNSFEELVKIIRDSRKEQKISQEELAGVANTGVRFIIDLEKAKKTCQIKKVFDVIQALGIKIGVSDDD